MTRPNTRRAAYLAPIALLWLAFGLRAFGVGAPSLWYEEGYSIEFVTRPVLAVITDIPRLELNMPLHYVMLKGWMALAGNSEFSARFLSVLLGVLTVALAARLANRRRMLGMAVVAISAVSIYINREARMYAPAAAFCALAAWLWQRGLARPGGRVWAVWALASLAAVCAHVLSAIPCAIQIGLAGWHLWRSRAPRSTWRPFVIATGATSAAVLGLGIISVGFARGYGTTFAGALNAWTTVRDSAAAQLLPRALPEALRLPAFGALVALVAGAWWWARPVQRRMLGMAMLCLAAIIAFSLVTGKFAPRYATFITPMLMAAVAGAPAAGRARALRAVPGLALLGVLLAALALWLTLPVYAAEDYRAAAAYARRVVQADETVLVVPGHLSPVFEYYYGPDGWSAIPPDPVLDVRHALDYPAASRMLNEALAGKRGAWVFAWEDDVIDPSHVVLSLLRRQAHLLGASEEVRAFNGPRLVHFRFDAPYQPAPAEMPALASSVDAGGPQRGLGALGCGQLRRPAAGDSLMEIACFWQIRPDSGLPYNTQVSLRLSDAFGKRIAQIDQQLAADGLPYFPFDKPLTAIYFVPLPPATGAGAYELVAVPYTPQGELAPRITTRVVVDP